MSMVDQISRGRVGFLLLNGIAFAVWQMTEIGQVKEMLTGSVASALGTGAVALWIFTMAALFAPAFTRNRVTYEDELTRQNRRTAFSWGYWVAIAVTVLALFVASNTAASAEDLLRLVLIASVTVPIIRFAVMERSAPDGE
jgi:hypothetical protein